MTYSKQFRCFGLILCAILILTIRVFSQSPRIEECELILLELNVERAFNFELDARLCSEELYVPVEMFSDLKVPFEYNPDKSILTVRFPDSEDPFRFDFKHQVVQNNIRSSALTQDDFFIEKEATFIRKEMVAELMEMDLIFDYRNLKLILFSNTKLPVIEFHERKQRYKYLSEPKRQLSADVTRPAKRHLLEGWVADWSLSNSHNIQKSNYAYNLGLGGHILGGNLSLRGSGSRREAINWNHFRGRWSYPIYSGSLIKQIQVGDLMHEQMPATESGPFQGISITNRPNAPRHYFGSIVFSDHLNRGWDAELYVNHRFKDYATSGSDHSFRFTAPLRYGSNLIQLKHYDTYGLNRQEEYLIHIPREFLPSGKLEYDLTAGRYSNYTDRYFGRMNFSSGLSSNVTIGGGSLFESTANEEQFLPFVQTWIRAGKHIIFRGGHTMNRLSRGSFKLALPGSQSLMLDVKKYHIQDNSVFNKTGKSFETSLNTSFPVRLPFANFSALLSSRYIKTQSDRQSMYIYSGISTSLPLGVHLRANSRFTFRNIQSKKLVPTQITTKTNFSKRLFRNLMLRPGLEYSHSRNKVRASELSLRYRITSDIYMDFSFHRDHMLNNNRLQFSLRMDLPFARHTSSVRSSTNITTLHQNTSGSVHFDDSQYSFDFNKRRRLGKASLRVNPFMDFNHNGLQDSEEPAVEGVTVDLYKKDQTKPLYRNLQKVDNLVPYERYLVRINDAGLSNPLLKPQHRSYSVKVLPNSSNSLPVPIITTGEAAGKVVSSSDEADQSLLTGLRVEVISEEGNYSEDLETYWEGSFYYVGLKPGNYTAALDPKQLKNRKLKAVVDSLTFTIQSTRQGDIVDGLTFEVAPQEFTPGSSASESYAIQIGAFKRNIYALRQAALARVKIGYEASVIYDDDKDLFISRFGSFETVQQAMQVLNSLKSRGPAVYPDAFVVEIREN